MSMKTEHGTTFGNSWLLTSSINSSIIPKFYRMVRALSRSEYPPMVGGKCSDLQCLIIGKCIYKTLL